MLGKRIQKLRKEQGLSLTETAERAGIAKSYLSNLERDIQKNPSIQVVEKIAGVLKVPIDKILDDEQATEQNEKIDAEWYELIQEAMNSNVDKQQFREFLENIKRDSNKKD